MKRYIIFAFDEYYPYGGHLDIQTHVDDYRNFDYKTIGDGYSYYYIYDCLKEYVVIGATSYQALLHTVNKERD